MRHAIFTISLILGIALSASGCGSSAPAKRRAAASPSDAVELPPPAGPVVVFPVQPGSGEQSVIAAAEDEIGSFLTTANQSGLFSVAQDRTMCAPGEPGRCKELPVTVCADSVETRVCEFDEVEGEPSVCHDVVIEDGHAVEIATSAPYVGVEMRAGVCVDAERRPTPIEPGLLSWCFPSENHPRAPGGGRSCVDMAEGGGSPSPGGGTWYTMPVVPPKKVSALDVPPPVFAPVAIPINIKDAQCSADWRRNDKPIKGALVCTASNSCLECKARAIKIQGAFWRACLPVTDGKSEFYLCSYE